MKKIIGFMARCAVRFVPLLLCPVTKYLFDVNEVVAILTALLWIPLCFFVERALIREKTKAQKVFTVLLTALSVLVFAGMVYKTELDPGWNCCSLRDGIWEHDSGNAVLTRKEALKDLNYMMKYVKKVHPLTRKGLPDEMAKKEKEVREWINSQDRIEGYVLAAKFESILTPLEDGHTFVEENYTEYHWMKRNYEHNIAGDTLVGINGQTFEEFLKEHPGLCSYDTGMEVYGEKLLRTRVKRLEWLRYLGVDVSGQIVYNYVTKDGEAIEDVLTAEDFLLFEDYLKYEEEVTGDDLHQETEDRGFVYYDIDEEASLAILTVDECSYNETYRNTVKKMFEEVASKGITNVAVDLRGNSGGSSMVGNEFISYLDVDSYQGWDDDLRMGPFLIHETGGTITNRRKGEGFTGNVYVLTGVHSFSAAMDFAMLIGDNDLGVLIGQPCGNLPAGYGNIKRFQLPNSKLIMQVSMMKWYRVDMSKNDLPLIPDYECPENEAMDVLRELISKD